MRADGAGQDLADPVGAKPRRRGAPHAGPVGAAWRLDDALRVAPGAHRRLGILLLRRRGRARRGSRGGGGARGARSRVRVFPLPGLLPEGCMKASSANATEAEGASAASAKASAALTSVAAAGEASVDCPPYVRAIAPYP